MSVPADDRATPGTEVTHAPTVSTASPAAAGLRWWSAIPSHLGRLRTSTVVLSVLFVAVLALYFQVKPETTGTGTAGTGTVQQPAVPTTDAPAPTSLPVTTEPAPTTEPEPTETTSPTGTTSPTTTSSPTTSSPGTAGSSTSGTEAPAETDEPAATQSPAGTSGGPAPTAPATP